MGMSFFESISDFNERLPFPRLCLQYDWGGLKRFREDRLQTLVVSVLITPLRHTHSSEGTFFWLSLLCVCVCVSPQELYMRWGGHVKAELYLQLRLGQVFTATFFHASSHAM